MSSGNKKRGGEPAAATANKRAQTTAQQPLLLFFGKKKSFDGTGGTTTPAQVQSFGGPETEPNSNGSEASAVAAEAPSADSSANAASDGYGLFSWNESAHDVDVSGINEDVGGIPSVGMSDDGLPFGPAPEANHGSNNDDDSTNRSAMHAFESVRICLYKHVVMLSATCTPLHVIAST